MRRRALLLPLLLVTAVLLPAVGTTGAAASAAAGSAARPTTPQADRLPPDWSWEGSSLVWSSDAPLPIGGARPEFRAGDTVLGYPVAVGTTLRLDGVDPSSLVGDLSVWLAARRLDGPTPGGPTTDPVDDPAARESRLDPARRGPFETWRRSYDLAPLDVPGYEVPIEVLGEVTAPVGADRMPLVLLLHGRHSTCWRGDQVTGDWPCRPGWRPIASQSGYRYMADVLASQGNLVVSVSANGINAQDFAEADGGAGTRSLLVRHHLDLWARWNERGTDPWGGRFAGKVDLDAVVLMGHSRGGEGVVRAAVETRPSDPWAVEGLVLIAPTAFMRQAAPGAHTVVLLPSCDGDVSDLQGQQYVDVARDAVPDGALRSAVFVGGANHNFFNTEWTPSLADAPADDDGAWSQVCGSGAERLSPARQQAVGLAYTSALVRLVTRSSRSAFELLDGRRLVPKGLDDVRLSVAAVDGSGRRVIDARSADVRRLGDARVGVCAGAATGVAPRQRRVSECIETGGNASPHWMPVAGVPGEPLARGVRMDWTGVRSGARFRLDADLERSSFLDLRVVVPGSTGTVPLLVRVRDADGDAARLPVRLVRPQAQAWQVARQVRFPLAGLPRRIDTGAIRGIDVLALSASGSLVVLDAWVRTDDVPAASGSGSFPVVSIGRRSTDEGATTQVFRLPLDVTGRLDRPARVLAVLNGQQPSAQVLTLEPGRPAPVVEVVVRGNDLFDGTDPSVDVVLFPLRNVAVADPFGGVRVREDDPAPRLTVDRRSVATTEGGDLVWTFRLSAPLTYNAGWGLLCDPTSDPAFTTSDLDPSEFFGLPEAPAPLCAWPPTDSFFFQFEPGQTEVSIVLTTADDGETEAAESVRFLLLPGWEDDPILQRQVELTATIRSSP